MASSFVADIPTAIPDFLMTGFLMTDFFNEMGSGKIRRSITTNSLSMFETLAARGDLLEYIELLGGAVNSDISLNDNGSVTMTVNQVM